MIVKQGQPDFFTPLMKVSPTRRRKRKLLTPLAGYPTPSSHGADGLPMGFSNTPKYYPPPPQPPQFGHWDLGPPVSLGKPDQFGGSLEMPQYGQHMPQNQTTYYYPPQQPPPFYPTPQQQHQASPVQVPSQSPPQPSPVVRRTHSYQPSPVSVLAAVPAAAPPVQVPTLEKPLTLEPPLKRQRLVLEVPVPVSKLAENTPSLKLDFVFKLTVDGLGRALLADIFGGEPANAVVPPQAIPDANKELSQPRAEELPLATIPQTPNGREYMFSRFTPLSPGFGLSLTPQFNLLMYSFMSLPKFDDPAFLGDLIRDPVKEEEIQGAKPTEEGTDARAALKRMIHDR